MRINFTVLMTCAVLVTGSHGFADVTLDHTNRGAFANPLASLATGDDGYTAHPLLGYLVRAFNFELYQPGAGTIETERNFHTFDLSHLSGTIETATLRVWLDSNAYDSTADFETVGLFEVTTAAATLNEPTADNGGPDVFDDLGSGTSYGGFNVTAADSLTYIDVDLNANAVAALNDAVGVGSWSVGGALQTIDGTFGTLSNGMSERVLKNDSATPSDPAAQLVLTGSVVPEPASLALLMLGCGVLLRRKQK